MLYYFPTIKRDLLVRLVPTLPALVQVGNNKNALTQGSVIGRTHGAPACMCVKSVFICVSVATSKTRPTG